MRIRFVMIACLPIIGALWSNAAFADTASPAVPESPPPKPPEASPNDLDGQQVFLNICGYCHQGGGRVAGRGPKLSNSARSDEYIIERIKKGKPGAMPAFGSVFSDGQIIAILAYIRGLDD